MDSQSITILSRYNGTNNIIQVSTTTLNGVSSIVIQHEGVRDDMELWRG